MKSSSVRAKAGQRWTDVRTATVFKNGILAGTLSRDEAGIAFRYLPTYDGPDISLTLSRHAEFTGKGGALPPFFAGLLPEGARLSALRRSVKTSYDDELSLLLAVGGDCVGDVQVGATEEAPSIEAVVRNPKWDELVFEDLFYASIGERGTFNERAALPGVQEKVSATVVSFPVVGTTHILKLAPAKYPRIVENEIFFMRLARSLGFETAEVRVVHDARRAAALLVTRFDRTIAPRASGKTNEASLLTRYAQEDACQFLSRVPADKYRLNVRDVADGFERFARAPMIAISRWVAFYAYSYLIGNGDLHGKNVSLRQSIHGGWDIAPLYDVLSTIPYGDERMAMRLEGRDARLSRKSFVTFATRCLIPSVAVHRMIDELTEGVSVALERIDEIGFDTKATLALKRAMKARIETLRR